MTLCAVLLATTTLAVLEPEPVPWHHTLFLQFDGASLSWVPSPDDENAALGLSFLSKFEGSEIPPYDGDATDRAAVLAAVRDHFAGVGVRVVDERPNEWVPYTMAVVGGQWDDTAATSVVRGSAPEVDCERLNQRHVVFAFVGSDEPSVQQATTISQEAGHAWGLDHVLGDGLVMSYDFAALVSGFSDGCAPLCEEACQGKGSVYCQDVHEAFCEAGMQDSVAELLYTFGPAAADEQAPIVDFIEPADGALLAPGSDLAVEIEVTDDFGGVGWRFVLLQDGVEVAAETAFERQTTWGLATLPEGSYEVRVIAEDHADHVTEASVFVEVADEPASTGAADDTTTGDRQPGDSTSGGASDDTTGSAGMAPGTDEGCACTTTHRTPVELAWLLVLPLLRRRRDRPLPRHAPALTRRSR